MCRTWLLGVRAKSPASTTTQASGSRQLGGLFHVSDCSTFMLFKAVEMKPKERLPQHLKSSGFNIKASLATNITEDSDVQYWCVMTVDIDSEDSATKSL